MDITIEIERNCESQNIMFTIKVLFQDFFWRVCQSFRFCMVIFYRFGGKPIKETRNPEVKQSCKDLFIWTELPIV